MPKHKKIKNDNMCCEKHLLAKHFSFACTVQSVTNKDNKTIQNKERSRLICPLHIVSTKDN